MRHDIRTPLTGIVGFSEILGMEFTEPRIKEYTDNIVASSHALLDLLDEVLDTIRVSSGEIPNIRKKFSLNATLQKVIDLNRALAAQKKLNLTLQVDNNIPQYLIGDSIRIHRIALELVTNALNFTKTGFVTLKAILGKRINREVVIKLIVEDSGIGIPKNMQQEIYVQFKRLTPSYQSQYKGVGLGLSVTKQFIEELGGEIYVESEESNGTRFTCVIPLHEPLLDDDLGVDNDIQVSTQVKSSPTDPDTLVASQPPKNDSHTVLVVEDNLVAQQVAKAILGQYNCEVHLAGTGTKARALATIQNYDLIFMDIGLPDMDGYEVTELIRAHELPQKRHVPIIALTAHAGENNKKRCIQAGMNAVLTKPLTIKNCTDIVNSFITLRARKETPQVALKTMDDLPTNPKDLFHLDEFPSLDSEEGIKTTGTKTLLIDMLRCLIHESLPKDLALMEQGYIAQDWDKIQQMAHKIKSGAVYLGTIKIKMACQYLERYWKSGQRDLLEPLYKQALDAIKESICDIEAWLNQQ